MRFPVLSQAHHLIPGLIITTPKLSMGNIINNNLLLTYYFVGQHLAWDQLDSSFDDLAWSYAYSYSQLEYWLETGQSRVASLTCLAIGPGCWLEQCG